MSGGSLGHPRILPWCPLRHSPPCCPEDSLHNPGSSLGVQAPMLSGGSLGHPGILPWCPLGYPGTLLWCPLRHRPPCCLEDPLEIPESSLGVPSDTGPLLSGGSLGHPRILPSCPLQTQAPMLSGGSQDPSPPFTSVQGKWTTCTCAISLCGCEGVRLPL